MFKKKAIILSLVMLWCYSLTVSAYVMDSSNYRMEKDSINIGGTEDSTSSNYQLRDTMGEVGTGQLESANYLLQAGYRQMDEVYLSISTPGPITLAPNIGGVTGGSATGNGTWTVKTDSPAGYYLSIRATSSPAMQSSSASFADYTPASAGTPDYSWNILSADSEFGFSPYNASSQIAKYKNNDSDCNAGSNITDEKCWYGLATVDEQIANKASRTDIVGEETKINFKAEVNTSALQTAGTYTATVVVTAVSN